MTQPKEQRITKPYRPWWKVAAIHNQQSIIENGAVTCKQVRKCKEYRQVVSVC